MHIHGGHSPHDPHIEEHFESPEIVRDLIIGVSDGLTVPFALAAGITGAISNNLIVVTAGIAEIAAGSIAMGLGAIWQHALSMNIMNLNVVAKSVKSSRFLIKKKKSYMRFLMPIMSSGKLLLMW